jgi:hypothetical protein
MLTERRSTALSAAFIYASDLIPNWIAEPSFTSIIVILIALQALYLAVKIQLEYSVRKSLYEKYIMIAVYTNDLIGRYRLWRSLLLPDPTQTVETMASRH